MNKKQAKMISTLFEYKIDTKGLRKLREAKQDLESAEGLDYLRQVFDILGLEEVFNKLGLDIPTFGKNDYEDDSFEDDDEKETETDKEDISEGVRKIKKSFFKWPS